MISKQVEYINKRQEAPNIKVNPTIVNSLILYAQLTCVLSQYIVDLKGKCQSKIFLQFGEHCTGSKDVLES